MDWINRLGLSRLYGMDIVCKTCQCDRDWKAVMGPSDWIILGIWIGWSSVDGHALVDCVFASIVCFD